MLFSFSKTQNCDSNRRLKQGPAQSVAPSSHDNFIRPSVIIFRSTFGVGVESSSSSQTEGQHGMSGTYYYMLRFCPAVCFVSVGLGEQNISRKWLSLIAAFWFAGMVVIERTDSGSIYPNCRLVAPSVRSSDGWLLAACAIEAAPSIARVKCSTPAYRACRITILLASRSKESGVFWIKVVHNVF